MTLLSSINNYLKSGDILCEDYSPILAAVLSDNENIFFALKKAGATIDLKKQYILTIDVSPSLKKPIYVKDEPATLKTIVLEHKYATAALKKLGYSLK